MDYSPQNVTFPVKMDFNPFLPVIPAIVLILLSIGLTLIGGIIPSKKAAKSDPVTALRTE